MDFVLIYIKALFSLAEKSALSLLTVLVTLVALFLFTPQSSTSSSPPSLNDPIPYVFNTLQFLFSNDKFTKRALKALKNARIVKFHLGLKPVYLISGPQCLQVMFSSRELSYEEIFVRHAFPKFWKFSSEEVEHFARDKSGSGRIPLPGTGTTPPDQRFWAARHHVHHDFLGRPNQFKPIIDAFGEQFSRMNEKFPLGEWTTISVINFCKCEVAECAISTLFGPNVLALNPDFLDAFWEFDAVFFNLILGLPRWITPRPFNAHDRYLSMIDRHLTAALEHFDWNGPDAEALWEPCFGARICRELVKWLMEAGFQRPALNGALGSLLFAQNSNSVPTATWMLMELFKDPSLFQAVREEVATAEVAHSEMHTGKLDVDKLVTLPLLQSIFTETLRLRMSLNIIRTLEDPISLDGIEIAKGSMLQAPTMAAHYDEVTWGRPGHPACQFWAERHLKYVEERDQTGQVYRKRTFNTSSRPTTFFPFGGGSPICPGRHFAKAEIFTMVGLMVNRFDIEFVGWTKLDGSPSDRPAENDPRYSAAGSSPPDRDMMIRLKRKW
ncbi:putative cytochrome P450 [Jackrogersella minutella]|nr:putative cytochrome P450 [Jackrogersella minutella]